jgi:hypothetical protein
LVSISCTLLNRDYTATRRAPLITDKFFVRNANVIQPAGAERLVATGVGHITGGTGKLGSIQGTARQVTTFDPIAGVPGENQVDLEYSIGK